ncbi:alpha-ketoacid dehydrogenase subunit alpha/beta [Eisenibacter elegans]|jgi:2-oxoisovalerate dehydrogenase E1 component|uniref:alpha-ketoacid dehydrogenase subunit alpha/beta n=1 Tax=Eisenibacter elegans TaxID=997 RepID=UPI00047A916A|nr:dehydrogenase E1 component subunit alpha/beta [Eisenibacter elegans]
MSFDRHHYTDAQLLALYQALVRPRMIEEKMLVLLRQGRASKWFAGIGQEAIAVGATLALRPTDYILPLHRNLGVFTSRNVPLDALFKQFQGKKGGFTKGRDRSFHFGTHEHHIVGMISHLGPQLSVANGIALAETLEQSQGISLAFSGEGATSQGEFHEALNVAAVWDLPVIFVIENNGYGLSTPISEQFRCERLADKGIGYGIESHRIDGNNILEVYHTIAQVADSIRQSPRPILIEAMTFRMRGHEEASGTKYVPQALFDEWALKDPISNYEKYLLDQKILDQDFIQAYRQEVKQEIEAALEQSFAEPIPTADIVEELADVYAPHHFVAQTPAPNSPQAEIRFIDAISQGLRQALEQHPKLLLMGQDIAEYGGAFKVTEGFVQQFGKGRVRNTPLCESAIVGAGLGLAVKGHKSVIEMQFADFVSCGFNQIVNNLAKIHYRWGQAADVVIRMPTGAGVGAGPFHSQSNESWFFHTPGLKVVYPATPYDAKGLLLSSIEDPNPVMFFEHKALYRAITAAVPEAYYTLPIGQAQTICEGEEATIITYGMGVHWATKAIEAMGLSGKVAVIDLRTLLPWDQEAVAASVRQTGKVLVLHEDSLTGGIAAEIASWIGEYCFQWLDAPVMRLGSLDTPVPFAIPLEQAYLPVGRLEARLQTLLDF